MEVSIFLLQTLAHSCLLMCMHACACMCTEVRSWLPSEPQGSFYLCPPHWDQRRMPPGLALIGCWDQAQILMLDHASTSPQNQLLSPGFIRNLQGAAGPCGTALCELRFEIICQWWSKPHYISNVPCPFLSARSLCLRDSHDLEPLTFWLPPPTDWRPRLTAPALFYVVPGIKPSAERVLGKQSARQP